VRLAAENAIVAALYALVIWAATVRPLWPWDLRGRRKTLTARRGRRPFE
jgi:hypothetical protein